MALASKIAISRALMVGGVALTLAACGGTSANNTAPAAPASATSATSASPSSSAPVGTSVGVVEKEFSITLAQPTFTAGPYTFMIQNQGAFPHNLIIDGPGVDKEKSPTLPAGKDGSLSVNLQKGTYELWCGVDSHKEKGMDLKITVG